MFSVLPFSAMMLSVTQGAVREGDAPTQAQPALQIYKYTSFICLINPSRMLTYFGIQLSTDVLYMNDYFSAQAQRPRRAGGVAGRVGGYY